ncbi:hypothetical protein [Clostridium aciditolerans]|uniref:Uncharacterized protein n=1 Tax=Clostridium aciditolerans TaxID=339861 RepID=A0A934I2G9_9CLOT|nr:hypothetical protein [Clostridium aciditolerans]MBI6875617.1 hypothetical protein [Clostridium aciditolerans]
MNSFLKDLFSYVGSTSLAGLLIVILNKYVNEKLKGEINKDIEKFKGSINKDNEKFKGEINKDNEKFKGEINKDIEEFKIKEARANLISSRYVDVVTSERILWLEKIREDISKIVGLTRLIFSHDEIMTNYFNATLLQSFMKDKSNNDNSNIYFEEFKNKLDEKNQGISELLQVITKLKLRLNYDEDSNLIKLLGKIECGIISKINKEEMINYLNEVVNISHVILKKEWNKVKKEVMEGKEDKIH